MSHLAPSTSSLQSMDTIVQSAISGESQRQSSPHTDSIHILDDNSLLNVFNIYRPFLSDEDRDDAYHLIGGSVEEGWVRRRWWYKLAHVCQRWRRLIFGSAFYLDVCLVCTNGTPVADMLAHSPPLPLALDYYLHENRRDITAKDEEGILFALKQRNRVRRIRLNMRVSNLQKLIVAIDEEYPILEQLIITHPSEENSPILLFPETLQAPHLRHLTLKGFTLPIESQLLTTAVGLVTLWLYMIHPSTYFHPDTLLQWLSFMPQLQVLAIGFCFPVFNRDVERQLMHTPVMTPVTLPNLHYFWFQGVGTYLEAFIPCITTPRLGKLQIFFNDQLTCFMPCLLQFMNTTENLKLESARFVFSDERVNVEIYPYEEAETYVLSISVKCCHLDWQVSSVAQIFNPLSQVFSVVEHLTLKHRVHRRSSEEHNEVDHTEWRKLLGSFSNVKTIWIAEELTKDLSRCLQLEDGEPALKLLPELQELTYSGSGNTGDGFTSFVNARQSRGQLITLVRHDPGPDPGSSVQPLETSSITPASSEAGNNLVT